MVALLTAFLNPCLDLTFRVSYFVRGSAGKGVVRTSSLCIVWRGSGGVMGVGMGV